MLIQQNLIVEKSKEITVDEFYRKEYEQMPFDEIEGVDSTINGIEYIYDELFDVGCMIDRMTTPEMDKEK